MLWAVVGNIVSLNDAEVLGQHVVGAVDSDGGAGGVVALGVRRGSSPIAGTLWRIFERTGGTEFRRVVESTQRGVERCTDPVYWVGHTIVGDERQRGLMVGDALVALLVVGAGGGQHVAAGSDVERVAVVDCCRRRVGNLDIAILPEVEKLVGWQCAVLAEGESQRMVGIHVDAACKGDGHFLSLT